MTGQEWGEWGVVGFAMSVLAWVIYRLTGVVVKLVHPGKTYEDEEDRSA